MRTRTAALKIFPDSSKCQKSTCQSILKSVVFSFSSSQELLFNLRMFCEYGPISAVAVLELLITSHCLHQQMERPQLSLDCRCSNVKNFFFLKQTRSSLNVFIVQQIECFLSRRFEKTNIFRTAVSGLWGFSKIGR